MSDHNTPNDAQGFTLTAFIAFVVVFVFAMLMMLWHGDTQKDTNGTPHYNTRTNEPTDGNGG